MVDCNRIDSVPTVLQSLLVGGIDYSQDAIVMSGCPNMADCVTKGWTHDKGRGGRSVNRSATVE